MRLAVVGSGYVGAVVAGCLAHVGHDVVGVEVDSARLASLAAGAAPFYEEGLDDLLAAGIAEGRLEFTDDLPGALAGAEVVFICVGTPPLPDGTADTSAIEEVARAIAVNLDHPMVIVTKSTVPIGTGRWIATLIEEIAPAEHASFSMVSNPEFLREGSSVADYLNPDRVVIGSDDPSALEVMAEVYAPIVERRFSSATSSVPVPLLRTGLSTAEMIKYASNSFLAIKISYINEMARLCEYVGADVVDVAEGIGLDPRIGHRFLNAGLGWGGSCFGKDLAALVGTASDYRYQPRILQAAIDVNEDQRDFAVAELLRHLKTLRGARIALLGLAFKPGTDDLRDAPSVEIAERLIRKGAFVTATDPMVSALPGLPAVRVVDDPYEAVSGVDAVVLVTEWPSLLTLDLSRLKSACHGELFFDGRNAYDPAAVRAAGFVYLGIGRQMPARPRPDELGRELGMTSGSLPT